MPERVGESARAIPKFAPGRTIRTKTVAITTEDTLIPIDLLTGAGWRVGTDKRDEAHHHLHESEIHVPSQDFPLAVGTKARTRLPHSATHEYRGRFFLEFAHGKVLESF